MATPNLYTEASGAGNYPSRRFGKRERKMLASVVAGNSHRTLAAGTATTAGGDASETIAVSGALATDIAIVTVKTAGAVPRSIVAATAATNAITVTLSGDPSTDHVLQYVLLRSNT